MSVLSEPSKLVPYSTDLFWTAPWSARAAGGGKFFRFVNEVRHAVGARPGAGGEDEQELDEAAIAAALGFGGFASTKGAAVADNQQGPARGAAKVVPVRKYRQ